VSHVPSASIIPLPDKPGAVSAPNLLALHLTQPLTYLSGGSQTDVYRTADRRFVLKLKSVGGQTAIAKRRAAQMKQLADALYAYLSPGNALRTWFLVLADETGEPFVVGVQPFLDGAHPLDAITIDTLPLDRQEALLAHLYRIVDRSLACYRATGRVADVYGYGRKAGAEARQWDPRRLLSEGWRLISQHPLLTSHNLMLTQDHRVVLVDYDLICYARVGCRLIYAARALLLLRDRVQLGLAVRAILAGAKGYSAERND
jgi:hypothetical protein